MVKGTAAVLEPTFTGYVATTQDALILFEACLSGVLHHVPCRPNDRERSHLVRSGSVFIYEESSSGIKRWTDDVAWSPSRVLGNFLVYRELEKPFAPGEKKQNMKTNRRPLSSTPPGDPYPRQDSNSQSYSSSLSASGYFGERTRQSEVERALVGSLVDSYGFKESGLVKKTMSLTVSGVTHHLVSYYSVGDVMQGALNPPSMVERLRYIRPRAELTQKQSFRAPINDLDGSMDNASDRSPSLYGYRPPMMAPQGYAIPNPHPEFYVPGSHTATYPSQSASIPRYSTGGSISPPAAPATYLPAPGVHPQMPQKPEHFPQFRHPQYGAPGVDSFSQTPLSSSIPPAVNTAMPGSMGDRALSHSGQSASAYRNLSISSGSVATDTTSPLDPSTPAPYSRSSFNIPGHVDGSHPLVEQRGLTSFDPGISRRESGSVLGPYYLANDRQYYRGPLAPATHAGH